jgi:hypothetical protein
MMVYDTQNYWSSGLCPSSSILKTRKYSVRFEVFMAVTMKNGVFWDVMPCGSCKNHFLQEPHGVTSQKMPFFIENTMFQKLDLFPSSGDERKIQFPKRVF